MSEEEILKYIFCCVSYKHMFDLSPQITESAKKKEDLLFSSAVFYLRELGKGKNVFVEEFQKLPLKEKEKLVSVVQTWNKAFECGYNYAKKSAKKDKGIE